MMNCVGVCLKGNSGGKEERGELEGKQILRLERECETDMSDRRCRKKRCVWGECVSGRKRRKGGGRGALCVGRGEETGVKKCYEGEKKWRKEKQGKEKWWKKEGKRSVGRGRKK